MGAEKIDYGSMDLMDVHTAFSATDYGRVLAASVRYDKYRPAEVSQERWEDLLGPDVNNLHHLLDTRQLTRNFLTHTERLQPGLLSVRDGAVLEVGAFIHDWGEAIIPDKNYFEKTEADEAAERQAFLDNLPNFYRTDDEAINDLVKEAFENVIFDRDSRLGKIFNSIERIGYVRTALRADKHAREGTAPDCQDNFRWLAAAVFSNDHIATLITRGLETRAAHHFLFSKHEDIDAGLAATEPSIYAAYEPRQAEVRARGLEQGKAVWAAWCAGLESAARGPV